MGGTQVRETPAEPRWLAAAAGIVKRLPRGRYRATDALSRAVKVPAFAARFPRSDSGPVFECDLRNSLAREVYFTGQYEPQETALIEALVKSGQTFVDVGAHWGYFSLIASQKGRAGRTGELHRSRSSEPQRPRQCTCADRAHPRCRSGGSRRAPDVWIQ